MSPEMTSHFIVYILCLLAFGAVVLALINPGDPPEDDR